MGAGDPAGAGSWVAGRNPSAGLPGLNSEPRTARTTVKFIPPRIRRHLSFPIP